MAYCRTDYTQARQARFARMAAFYVKHVHDGVVPTMTELLVDLPDALAELRAAEIDIKSRATLDAVACSVCPVCGSEWTPKGTCPTATCEGELAR